MRSGPFLGAALAAALAAGAADAVGTDAFAIDDGEDLGRLCGAGPGEANYVAAVHQCHGYIAGVHHFHEASRLGGATPLYCLDAAAPPSRAEVAAAFAAWIVANPEAGQLEALDALMRWAGETHLCR